MKSGPIVVVGAASPLGEAIALGLRATGRDVIATYRRPASIRLARLEAAGARIRECDLSAAAPDDALAHVLSGAAAAIFTPILTTSRRAIPALRAAGVDRALFFSSNNVAVDPEAPAYAALIEAEAELRRQAPDALLVRPTLIYGDPALPAVARLVRVMRKLPVMPVPGNALQQPVFFRDLAEAAVGLLIGAAPPGRVYAIGGPDVITNSQFYRAVSRACGGVRLLVPTPSWAIAAGARLARAAGLDFPLDEAQIARLDQDKIAIPVQPLPAELTPRTGIEQGLAALVAAMGEVGALRARGTGDRSRS
jgi:nucleoside-diphosphate-sugar epimerase